MTIKPRPKLRAKLKKKIRYRSLHNPWKKPRRACSIWLQTSTELCESRGLPKAVQKQFEEQQEKSEGKDKGKPEPLLTMSQWKELLESNKKAASLPPTPFKAGLFTAACANIKATPRHSLQLASPTPAASTNTTPSVSTTRVEVVAALKTNLTIADNHNEFSLSSGYTVPVDAEQVIKQAALNCAEKYFDAKEKQGLPEGPATKSGLRNPPMENIFIGLSCGADQCGFN